MLSPMILSDCQIDNPNHCFAECNWMTRTPRHGAAPAAAAVAHDRHSALCYGRPSITSCKIVTFVHARVWVVWVVIFIIHTRSSGSSRPCSGCFIRNSRTRPLQTRTEMVTTHTVLQFHHSSIFLECSFGSSGVVADSPATTRRR